MQFLNRNDEMRRLDAALSRPAAFAVLWGRRRVGKSRLLIEWSRRHGGLYTVADQSAPPVQRRYLAEAVAERFPGFADVEYPDWRSPPGKHDCNTGGGTGRTLKHWLGRSCAGWRCPSCIGPTRLWGN